MPAALTPPLKIPCYSSRGSGNSPYQAREVDVTPVPRTSGEPVEDEPIFKKGPLFHLSAAWYQCLADPRNANWPGQTVIPEIESVVHGMKIADMNGGDRANIVMARMRQGDAPREVSLFLNGG